MSRYGGERMEELSVSPACALQDLENAAKLLYSQAVSEGLLLMDKNDQRGRTWVSATAHEVVGLGFEVEGEPELVWVRVANTAGVDSRQFSVTGQEIHDALASIRRAYPQGTQIVGAAIWHSHYDKIAPSKVDIRQFPTWLATVGWVYHTPTGVYSAYNSNGVIITNSPAALDPNASRGIGHGNTKR